MTQGSEFVSSLTDETRDVFDCVNELGIRTWQPAGDYAIPQDGLLRLFFVLDGILSYDLPTHLARILPHEVLRVDDTSNLTLNNPSRSDDVMAIELTLTRGMNASLSTRHHYFSDDQKDNKLCRVAACERDGRTLATHAPIDVYLTTLDRYDSVLLDRHTNQPLLVLCIDGKVNVNSEPMEALESAMAVDSETATVIGNQPCSVLILRGPAPID